MEFEEGLVHAAEFFGAKVQVVHGAQHAVVAGEGEFADGFEQGAIGEGAAVEGGGGFGREEESAEGGQSELRAAFGASEQLHDKAQGMVEVAVAGASAAAGKRAQAGG